MRDLVSWLSQPWPWYVAGVLIAAVMFGLLFFGKRFGLSSNLRTICSAFGAGKSCEFFDFDWKAQSWNLVFVLGTIIGGFIANRFLSSEVAIALSTETVKELQAFGIVNPGKDFMPNGIFSFESLLTLKGFIVIVVGGFLVGFGTRYAGGCTSGHAISGLSNLQLPSLIAVIGFFVGGLFITHFVLPYLLTP